MVSKRQSNRIAGKDVLGAPSLLGRAKRTKKPSARLFTEINFTQAPITRKTKRRKGVKQVYFLKEKSLDNNLNIAYNYNYN